MEKKPCCGHDCRKSNETPPEAGEAVPPQPGEISTTVFIAGMDCADEVAALHRVLRPIPGVYDVQVNLLGGKAVLRHAPECSFAQFSKAIASAGMKASLAPFEADEESHKKREVILVAISGVALGAGLIFESAVPEWASALYLISIATGGWLIAPKAWSALRHRSLDMNVLMTVAVVGALLIQQWSEAAAVTFLFALSELLEAFSLERARRAIRSLMDLTPETAWLIQPNGEAKETPVGEIALESLLLVKSGARIPLDGVVVSGASSVNQAPITGEAMPVEKAPGDFLFAGTINGPGALEFRTTTLASDSTLARMLQLMEKAQSQKAPAQRFVDRFARIYTPLVMIAALLVVLLPPLLFGGLWGTWIYRGLVLLVIACPCALVISTPVSIVSGLTSMARRGVLVKGGAILEAVGKITALAVDKTGTITEGTPKVLEVIPLNGHSPKEIVRIAAGIDRHSSHPIAQAVLAYAQGQGILIPGADEYESKTGRGAQAKIEGHLYFVGNHRFAHETAVCTPELESLLGTLEAKAQSVVVVGHLPHDACGGEIWGVLAVGDAVRPVAAEAVAALHAAGVHRVVMLSGDNQRTVATMAKEVGIDEALGDLLPEEKIDFVKTLVAEGERVAMIGDGVNDAPAMAAAHVGIAMGNGTDTALEAADMALMQNDLRKVAEAIHLGRRAVRIIQTNIAFALVTKAIFLVLALTGNATLWVAIAADTGATLLVIANAMRLLQHRDAVH